MIAGHAKKWHLIYDGITGIMVVTAQSMDIRVASNGRMVLPLSVRRAMGLQGETKVILTVEDDQVRLSPIGHGVSRAQALYRRHASDARTTDDFLDNREADDAGVDPAGPHGSVE